MLDEALQTVIVKYYGEMPMEKQVLKLSYNQIFDLCAGIIHIRGPPYR